MRRQVQIGGAAAPVDETGISWGQDRAHKFAALPATFLNTDPALAGGGQVPGTLRSDEHLIVWMRPASLPNFRKLWGRLRRDLDAGATLTLIISNRHGLAAPAGTLMLMAGLLSVWPAAQCCCWWHASATTCSLKHCRACAADTTRIATAAAST